MQTNRNSRDSTDGLGWWCWCVHSYPQTPPHLFTGTTHSSSYTTHPISTPYHHHHTALYTHTWYCPTTTAHLLHLFHTPLPYPMPHHLSNARSTVPPLLCSIPYGYGYTTFHALLQDDSKFAKIWQKSRIDLAWVRFSTRCCCCARARMRGSLSSIATVIHLYRST